MEYIQHFQGFFVFKRYIHIKYRGLPGSGTDQSEKNPDRCAFARPVGTDKAEKLAFPDSQAEIGDTSGVPVILGEVIDSYNIHSVLLSAVRSAYLNDVS